MFLISSIVLFLAYLFIFRNKPLRKISVEFPPEIQRNWTGAVVSDHSIKDGKMIRCYDPATGYSLGSVMPKSPQEMKEIVLKARNAQQSYKETSFTLRKDLLGTLLDWVVENQEMISRMTARDSGKTLIDASFGEILTTCEKIRWTIANGESVLAPEYRTPGLIMAHKVPRVEYHPLGVMGAIVSWNYPFHNVVGPIVSALMAGNAIVIKTSEHVAWSTGFWQTVFDELLSAYGLDTNLVQLVNGWADAGEALVESADKITFIGSPEVGKLVMKHASNTLTPVILELGGKDVAIVFDDADYDQVVQVALRGTFQNSGQNCAGLERLVVHEAIYEKLISDMLKYVSKLRVGPPLEKEVDMGAMTMHSQINKVQVLVDDAVKKGARLLVGGKSYTDLEFPNGQYFAPTLLVDVTKDMRIAQEEVFGPVMCIMKFSSEEEAVDLANSSPYALGSSIFTLDVVRGERIAKRIRAGMCNVNDFGANYLCQALPFGGVGISGIDRFAGVEGLRGNCNIRSATSDRFYGVRTNLPPLLRFPLSGASIKFQESLIGVLYGSTWAESLKSFTSLISLVVSGKA